MGVNVIVMGPPGAGKGTQAARFASARGVPKISTGDMLREAIRAGNPAALEAKARMDQGELVDDETIVAIVADRLSKSDAKRGFVLDGFPRTVAQARALDDLVQRLGTGPLIVVDVAVPEQELVRRLANRRICSACGMNAEPSASGDTCPRCGGRFVQRSDDDQRVVVERLRVYQQSTRPVLDFYRGRSTFRVVDGAQSPEQVAVALHAVIEDASRAARGKEMGTP